MNYYPFQLSAVNNPPVRTVSDAKRDFYTYHTRPINSIYRRVVDELLVEMHLLSVNDDFAYDPIYALGIVTSFDRFMVGYQPDQDRDSIFSALCRSVQSSPAQYRGDAAAMKAAVAGMTLETFKAQFDQLLEAPPNGGLRSTLSQVANREEFKYSRAFGIGLYTLLEAVADDTLLGSKDSLAELIKILAGKLNLSIDKLTKDLELYRSNLEKFAQAQEVIKDMLAAERKKREERQQVAPVTSETVPGAEAGDGNG
jgi:photosystem II biogenesis protein Psp29